MAPRLALILLLLAAVLAVEASMARNATGLVGDGPDSGTCVGGRVGDCSGEDGELDLDSAEETRRFLYGRYARQKFISYNALNKNRVPCSRRGNSYYNCQTGKQANPYRRGCTAITMCARDLS